MPRALFEKTGNAVYISHLDLMRLFHRAFKRAGLALKHTQGFNPRPSVSIAMPLSLGMESRCELLDFELEGEPVSNEEVVTRLNDSLIEGVKILSVYDNAAKLKNLSFLDCCITLVYDRGISEESGKMISALFVREHLIVEKKGKNGATEQDISPLIRSVMVERINCNELILNANICCQNPALNPMQLATAISKYLPELTPDFVRIQRVEVYDVNNKVFR